MIYIDNIHDLIQNDVTFAYLEAYARKDLEERYCRGARDFRLVHTSASTDTQSYYILVFKYKLYPNRDILYIYKYLNINCIQIEIFCISTNTIRIQIDWNLENTELN